jgi:hypothetical protein
MHEVIYYLDEAEYDLYQSWLESLRDRVAKVAIIKRVARIEVGLLAIANPCARASGNSRSTSVLDTACITRMWASE